MESKLREKSSKVNGTDTIELKALVAVILLMSSAVQVKNNK